MVQTTREPGPPARTRSAPDDARGWGGRESGIRSWHRHRLCQRRVVGPRSDAAVAFQPSPFLYDETVRLDGPLHVAARTYLDSVGAPNLAAHLPEDQEAGRTDR